jgi:hypothetical protein
MDNGVIDVENGSPHKFKHLSRRYYQFQENKMYEFGLVSNGITSKPNSMQTRSALLELCGYWRTNKVN